MDREVQTPKIIQLTHLKRAFTPLTSNPLKLLGDTYHLHWKTTKKDSCHVIIVMDFLWDICNKITFLG